MVEVAKFSSSGHICAISVGKELEGNTHCGLLYRTENGVYFIHLGHPLFLNNDPEVGSKDLQLLGYLDNRSHFRWKPFSGVHDSLLVLVRTKCISIASRNESLPYSVFHSEDTQFDGLGNLILGKGSTGLTCSTFVRTILKGTGIDLIDVNDWPLERDDDLIFVEALVKGYTKGISEYKDRIKKLRKVISETLVASDKALRIKELNKLHEYIQKLNFTLNEIKTARDDCFMRFKPEEIAGTGFENHSDMPFKFDYKSTDKKGAKELGISILEQLPEAPNKKY